MATIGSSIISSILFKSETVHPKGRVIRFDEASVDIELATGSMRERVLNLFAASDAPITAKDIAASINSNSSRVTAQLRQLIKEGMLEMIKIDGCVTEYRLTKKARKN